MEQGAAESAPGLLQRRYSGFGLAFCLSAEPASPLREGSLEFCAPHRRENLKTNYN